MADVASIDLDKHKQNLKHRLERWHGGVLAFDRVCSIVGIDQPQPGNRSTKRATRWLKCHDQLLQWVERQPEFEIRREEADMQFGNGTRIKVCLVKAEVES